MVRRLHRIACAGSSAQLSAMLTGTLAAPELKQLVEWFEKFQEVLPFGHGVFQGVRTDKDLGDVWQGTVLHFLTTSLVTSRKPYRLLKSFLGSDPGRFSAHGAGPATSNRRE